MVETDLSGSASSLATSVYIETWRVAYLGDLRIVVAGQRLHRS
jgi:hypothetical protein